MHWREHFERAPGNRAQHKMTPVVSCTLYEFPGEDVQARLRRASSDHYSAAMEAQNAVRSRLAQQGQNAVDAPGRKILRSFYCTIQDNGIVGAHNRYTAMYINYVYDLEEWVATDCAGVGDSKALAQQHAAQQLIQGGRYCMLPMRR